MSKRDIVKYTQALVAAGVMEMPLWMPALLRCGSGWLQQPAPHCAACQHAVRSVSAASQA